ncbi:pseudaminic acid synthase [Thalassotalea insulae]|nr:pseudaminic acid synthase [Thalassotalea insulae]
MEIEIDGRKIGPNYPPYIIAELSANHNGDIKKALKAIEVAAQTGVDAIKIQSYTADTMTIKSDQPDFQITGGLWDGYSLYDLYKWAETPYEWHKAIFEKAKQVGITLFSTPFDETAVDLLEELNAPAYKIASFEITDLPLIEKVAQTGKPIIMSTGMANIEEIDEAIATAKSNGCQQLVVLHCISGYPTPYEQANLATIPDLAKRFDILVGLSDHTVETTVSVTSIALGACVIEKHFTLNKNEPSPDVEFSLDPIEFKQLVKETKIAYAAIGHAGYECKTAELDNRKFRRSLYFVQPIRKGETITSKHVKRIRPGFGLAPKHLKSILGKTVNCNISAGTAVNWKLINHDI